MRGNATDHRAMCLRPKIFTGGQAYVALSQVRLLKRLQILELDFTKLNEKKPCNNGVHRNQRNETFRRGISRIVIN